MGFRALSAFAGRTTPIRRPDSDNSLTTTVVCVKIVAVNFSIYPTQTLDTVLIISSCSPNYYPCPEQSA